MRAPRHRRRPCAGAALLALALAAVAPAAAMPPDALSFDLPLGAQHCFRQSFAPRVAGVAELLVVDGPPGLSVSATVTDVSANALLLHAEALSHETRALPPSVGRPGGAPRGGAPSEFRVCVVATRPKGYLPPRDSSREVRPGETRRVFVSLREAGADEAASVRRVELAEALSRKGDLEGVEGTIDLVGQQLRRLSREIGELRERERYLAESGEDTAKRILRCSMLACAAIVVAGVVSAASMDAVLAKNARRPRSRLA